MRRHAGRTSRVLVALASLAATAARAGYMLPPKIVEATLPDFSSLPAKPARRVIRWSDTAVRHGGIAIDKARLRLRVLDAAGERYSEWSIAGNAPERPLLNRVARADDRLALLTPSLKAGPFWVESDRLYYKPDKEMQGPLWEIRLGFEPAGLGATARDSSPLLFWAARPTKFAYFPSARRELRMLTKTPSPFDPIAWRPCDDRRSILGEVSPDGLVRIVHFQDDRPDAVTIIDPGVDRAPSDTSAFAVASCTNLFIGGTYGIVRVSYEP